MTKVLHKKYRLMVVGCHDSTEITLTLTKGAAKFLEEVCRKVTEASMGECEPTMNMFEIIEE